MKEPNWFERTFDFSFPTSHFPYAVERVRGTPARLEELVGALPPDMLTTRPGDREWTIQEHAGHLLDLEELHLGRLEDFAAHRDVLRAADMTNKKTYEAEHNATSIRDILSSFRALRKQFVEKIEHLDEEEAARTAMHPRLGAPMRLIDLVFFTAEHDDHHLASITQIARALKIKESL